jgi:flagellar FliL protein
MRPILKVKLVLSTILVVIALGVSLPASAQNGSQDYLYYGFEPEIITNYISSGKKLGYIRVAIEIMVAGSANLEKVEQHAPLLRAAIVEILGKQSEDHIKSLSGREATRKLCLSTVNQLLEEETGEPLAKQLIFTKYLYE